jgi:hypothetical protein
LQQFNPASQPKASAACVILSDVEGCQAPGKLTVTSERASCSRRLNVRKISAVLFWPRDAESQLIVHTQLFSSLAGGPVTVTLPFDSLRSLREGSQLRVTPAISSFDYAPSTTLRGSAQDDTVGAEFTLSERSESKGSG